MEIDYNKFTEQELQVILDAARTINYGFGSQYPSHSEQMALLIEDLHFRVINQIVIQAHNASARSTSREASTPTHRTSVPTIWRNDFSKPSVQRLTLRG